MKNASNFKFVFCVMFLVTLACGSLTKSQTTPEIASDGNTESEESILTVIPISTPTTAVKLRLEVVQFQAWADRDGNVRVNVLMRNPYDFPIAPAAGVRVRLLNGAGESIRDQDLYFLDGISGGNGFLLPGEMVAANVCFTCERAPLKEEWKSVEFVLNAEDASEKWNYSTEVEVTVGDVSFDGDSPTFWINGTVKNNSDKTLGRIAARVFVFDQAGKLVGAAEASAWDVAPGASVSFNGYGIGQAPDGSFTYESNALGVNY
jgi:hypothetical protein